MTALPSRLVSSSEFEQLREARSILLQQAKAIEEMADRLGKSFCHAVELIQHCRGRVVVCGIGKAGLIGQKLVATLSSTGTPAQFLHPSEAVHGDLGCIQPDDVLLLMSHSGETEEVTQLLPLVTAFEVSRIAITAHETSTLGRACDVVLETGKIAEAGTLGLAPSCSTSVMLAVGDALALVTSQWRGFDASRFATFHPGGSLGRSLASVEEVMRVGEELRIASDAVTVREAISSANTTGRRTGAVMLVDREGHLTGVFTDSDLVRLLSSHRESDLDRPVADLMTRSPRTLPVDARVGDAVRLLSAAKLSELPVIDEKGRPVGLVDITDIVAEMPPEPASN